MKFIEFSQWDTEHFGLRVGKSFIGQDTKFQDVIEESAENKIDLLVCRCRADDTQNTWQMGRYGFELMGTTVTYSAYSNDLAIPTVPVDICIRSITEDEVRYVTDIASESFDTYPGHFHADPRINPDKCEDLYRKWAFNSCHDKKVADYVLVAEIGKCIAGFLTIKKAEGVTGSLVLAGVSHSHRRRGVYKSLLSGGVRWCESQGLKKIESSTQITNYPVQKAWANMGLRMENSVYIFHKWFSEVENK